jgi:hypothetical protein
MTRAGGNAGGGVLANPTVFAPGGVPYFGRQGMVNWMAEEARSHDWPVTEPLTEAEVYARLGAAAPLHTQVRQNDAPEAASEASD